MKKLITISISLSIIVVGVSIAYYFLIFLPQFKQQELNRIKEKQILENQIECQKNGMALYEKELGDVKDAFVPVYKFNEKLNTCLYKGGWFDYRNPDITSVYWYIKDVYSNKEIISYMSNTKDGKSEDLLVGGMVTKEEFDNKAKELFGE